MRPIPDQAEKLIYWINEREEMRKKKEAGEKWPFSKDPVMANNRYTNVRRENDKVTKWIAENMRYPRKDLSKWMCLARMVNYIPSLEAINNATKDWNPEIISSVLRDRVASGQKTWSSAYMITTCGKKMDKIDYVVNFVSDRVPEVGEAKTCREAFDLLRTVDGLGSFLAGQIVADLKHIFTVRLHAATDWSSFSVPGPGSLRGLSALYGVNVTPASYNIAISEAAKVVYPRLPPELQDLSMQDFQNCFCEFSKFVRGYGRNGYSG